MRPLDGIRVVTLAEQYPGPYATLVLADLGADVIFVERPGGDPTRVYRGHHEALNRGKRSIVLDLKQPDDLALMHALIETADVLVEGFRPGVADRLGVGVETCRNLKPDLIYVSISVAGQTGPGSNLGFHDLSARGMAGILTEEEATGAERSSVPPWADLAGAMWSVVATLGALLERNRTGRGAVVDVSMLEALLAWRASDLTARLNGLAEAPYPADPAYGVYRTADGRTITLSIAGEEHHWQELCRILDLPDLARLGREAREQHRQEVADRLRSVIGRRRRDELIGSLWEAGVACAPVYSDEELARDPVLSSRGLFAPITDGVVHVRHPVLYDSRTLPVGSRAPELNEHGVELRQEIECIRRQGEGEGS